MSRFLLSILLAMFAWAPTAKAQFLFLTSFENAAYGVGAAIDGVDGWLSFYSPDAARVVHGWGTASLGRRSVQCWGGSDLDEVDGLLVAAYAQPSGLDPAHPHPTRVLVGCDVRLSGPDTGNGPQDDLASANLYAWNRSGSAFFYVSSDGNIYAFASSAQHGMQGYRFPTPSVPGCYAHLAILLDYSTHQATFIVNGSSVGALPFGGGANEQFLGTILEFATYADPQVVDPSLYTASWDNSFMLACPN